VFIFRAPEYAVPPTAEAIVPRKVNALEAPFVAAPTSDGKEDRSKSPAAQEALAVQTKNATI
jgi:hypothetical protein